MIPAPSGELTVKLYASRGRAADVKWACRYSVTSVTRRHVTDEDDRRAVNFSPSSLQHNYITQLLIYYSTYIESWMTVTIQ